MGDEVGVSVSEREKDFCWKGCSGTGRKKKRKKKKKEKAHTL